MIGARRSCVRSFVGSATYSHPLAEARGLSRACRTASVAAALSSAFLDAAVKPISENVSSVCVTPASDSRRQHRIGAPLHRGDDALIIPAARPLQAILPLGEQLERRVADLHRHRRSVRERYPPVNDTSPRRSPAPGQKLTNIRISPRFNRHDAGRPAGVHGFREGSRPPSTAVGSSSTKDRPIRAAFTRVCPIPPCANARAGLQQARNVPASAPGQAQCFMCSEPPPLSALWSAPPVFDSRRWRGGKP